MGRILLIGVVGLVAAVIGLSTTATSLAVDAHRAEAQPCELWLDRPRPGWVNLRECRLDVDAAVLESDQRTWERLADRRRGLVPTPYETPPRWVALWVPLKSEHARERTARVLYRVDGADLLKWLNKVTQVDEAKRDAMWAEAPVLRRLSRPGVVQGEAAVAAEEGLVKAHGGGPLGGLLTLVPGATPPASGGTPFGVVLLVLGVGAVAVALRMLVRRNSTYLGAPTAEQELTQVDVKDVSVELGALEALRREEAEARRGK